MNAELPVPVIICEGKQEMKVASLLCENYVASKNIFQLGANGSSRHSTIARKIHDHIKFLDSPHGTVIVLLDREKSESSSLEIIQGVKRELAKFDYDTSQFIVGVADPTIESWILPFVDSEGNFPIEPTKGYDGVRCVGELKKRLNKSGNQYKKMGVGVEILCEITPVKLANVSKSFKNFYDRTKKVCNW